MNFYRDASSRPDYTIRPGTICRAAIDEVSVIWIQGPRDLVRSGDLVRTVCRTAAFLTCEGWIVESVPACRCCGDGKPWRHVFREVDLIALDEIGSPLMRIRS